MEIKMISNKFKDYLKCVYANKFTLSGYLLLLAGACDSTNTIHNIFSSHPKDIALLHHCYIDGMILYSGISLLAITSNGQETYNSYIQARRHIKQNGKLDPRNLEKIRRVYCKKVGIKLALKEANLEDRLS
jgi:hypothetical protein